MITREVQKSHLVFAPSVVLFSVYVEFVTSVKTGTRRIVSKGGIMNEITCDRKHIVPCINKDCACEWQLTATNKLEDDLIAWKQVHPKYCMRWRENNDKSRIINACDENFVVKE